MQNTKTKAFLDFLGLRKSVVGLLGMVVLVEMGEKMAEQFLPIYLLALGGSALSIGLLSGLDNLLSALYSFPGGYLSDRIGYKSALLAFNLLAIAGYAIVLLFPGWQAVIVGAILFISWSAISLPAAVSLVAQALPANKHTMGITLHSFVRRVPMALGPIAGGLLIGQYGEVQGIRITFWAAIILCLVSLVLQQVLIEKRERAPVQIESNFVRVFRALPVHLRHLLVSDILVRFCEQIPYAFIVVWAIKNVGITAVQFGILRGIEMGTAMLVYIPVAYLADRSTKRPYVAMTFVFFSAFPLFLLIANSFALLALAFVVRGLKEFGEPTRKALIMDLAPEGKKGSMFGVYYLARDLIVSLAAFGGAFLWTISPQTNFLVAFAFGILGTLYFLLSSSSSKKQGAE
ncbi:MAG TPA: MFS transporter [Anaerolineales bacterium]|nr:MFS transporter [Anaerolineales bacterium]